MEDLTISPQAQKLVRTYTDDPLDYDDVDNILNSFAQP